MSISVTDHAGSGAEFEHDRIIAEHQAYIIDALICEFDEKVTFWMVDCGHDEGEIRRYRWSEIGYTARHLYHPSLVAFAKKVAWTHI
ncbi:hypothetical protein ACG0Z5_17450 [Scandinavium sp. M-37]|uniref:hypothetical protein n=1 Tax=Scandinavium sp. M-37 TaxID=3373077 RepID=UPI003744EE37